MSPLLHGEDWGVQGDSPTEHMPGWISVHLQGHTIPAAWWTGHPEGIQRKTWRPFARGVRDSCYPHDHQTLQW